jgi:hypothetical protein
MSGFTPTHSDYRELEDEVELLKGVVQDSFRVVEFYAMRENWAFTYSTTKEAIFRDIIFDSYGFFDHRLSRSVYYGGKRAREFIKKHGPMLEEKYSISQEMYSKHILETVQEVDDGI